MKSKSNSKDQLYVYISEKQIFELTEEITKVFCLEISRLKVEILYMRAEMNKRLDEIEGKKSELFNGAESFNDWILRGEEDSKRQNEMVDKVRNMMAKDKRRRFGLTQAGNASKADTKNK